MKRLFLALLIIFPSLIIGQEKDNTLYTVTGKIIDASTQKPLEDATIIFKDLNTDHISFGGITNRNGKFSIEVKKGNYNASVEFLSFITKKLNISSISKDLNIGTIALLLDTEYLKEIEIIGEKKTLELKRNKLIFNVAKDISTAGSTAADILNNIPSVSVDPDGQISVQGQGQVQVMINGKTSLLTKADALKTLPAGSIESIEVITNPGAKYKASALSIINIVLKKGKDEGLNASITATGGFKDYYGGLITLNDKTEKINFFANANYFNRTTVRTSNSENEYFNNGLTTSFLNEKSNFKSLGKGFYTTFGADFYLSKNTTLTSTINYQNIENNNNTLTTSTIFDASNILVNSNERTNKGDFSNEAAEFSLDFSHNFKKEGRQLAAYISYLRDDETLKNKVVNTNNIFNNENFTQKGKFKNTIVYIEFSNPINEKSTYSIGYDGDFNAIPFSHSEISSESNIDYHTNINSTYFDYTYEYKKIYFDLGLRAEFAEIKLDYINSNGNLTKKFNDFSPSFSSSYSFSDAKSLTASYKRYIIRPNYLRLQPFEQKHSETSSYIGNPHLEPLYVNKGSLTYSYYANKFSFSSELFFTRYNDYWEEVTYETGEQIDGVNKIITTPVNLGKVDYYGINLTSTLKASKMLSFTGYINLLNFDQTGTFETINKASENIVLDYNNASINGQLSLFTQLKIPNVFNFQTQVKHFLISRGAYSTRKAYTYANAAINKDLFNKDATISLTVDDLFNSRKTDRDRFQKNYFSKSLIKNRYRTILLSFTYRFNQSKKDRRINFDKKNIKPNY